MSSVVRVFDVDFIIFDLIFAGIWILVLKKKQMDFELKFGIGGAVLIFFIDGIIWYSIMQTRLIIGPVQPVLFLLYFSTTYGIIMFSYVAIMFQLEENRSRVVWTGFLYIGWFLVAVLSQTVPIDDRSIVTSRQRSRLIQLIITIIVYTGLVVAKYVTKQVQHLTLRRIGYLFIVGTLVHLGMELTLFISGIRPQNIALLFFNSLVEFNNGIPVIYVVWTYLKTDKGHERIV